MRDGWCCHYCGLIPPACFEPKPEAIYNPLLEAAFVLDKIIIVSID